MSAEKIEFNPIVINDGKVFADMSAPLQADAKETYVFDGAGSVRVETMPGQDATVVYLGATAASQVIA